MSYGDSPLDGITIAMKVCEPAHPPLKDWPAKNLIEASCPACTHLYRPDLCERELKARRLLETRS